jgi:hypothetical protein
VKAVPQLLSVCGGCHCQRHCMDPEAKWLAGAPTDAAAPTQYQGLPIQRVQSELVLRNGQCSRLSCHELRPGGLQAAASPALLLCYATRGICAGNVHAHALDVQTATCACLCPNCVVIDSNVQ